jgi:hypothetical protein
MADDATKPKSPLGPSRTVMGLLTVAALVTLFSCYLVTMRAKPAELRLRNEGGELSPLESLYLQTHQYAYAVPVVIWCVGTWLTSAGEARKCWGVGLSVLMLAFALAWELGSHVLM